ncbi:uncharacterized protein CIMG_13082 [Coccidioides immitis RS]|uniref:Secreted protein n=1 Tax=Coccidioides immitis (strain RS) TaxID=246410 RepID=A0A0D8JUP2_COCIM|nr:uncharacterized protein CIMG_13082 [Coccidioides immitis RS]KJF60626.1 hypothetical protein CIMG_13082 [Coccidioides immitis RS]
MVSLFFFPPPSSACRALVLIARPLLVALLTKLVAEPRRPYPRQQPRRRSATCLPFNLFYCCSLVTRQGLSIPRQSFRPILALLGVRWASWFRSAVDHDSSGCALFSFQANN